jgi:hypothetical protein
MMTTTDTDAVTDAEIDQKIREDIMKYLLELHKENTASKKFETLDSTTQEKIKNTLTQSEHKIELLLNSSETFLFLLNEVFTAGRLAGVTYTLDHLSKNTTTTAKTAANPQKEEKS